MSPENDQTRWIGIRPVNPAENIPVVWGVGAACTKIEPCTAGTTFKTVEQSPLVSIKVEPKLATTEFKTLTKKRAPAVADVDAVESVVQLYGQFTAPSTGDHEVFSGNVPAGKIWIITYAINLHSDPTARTLVHSIYEGATEKARINQSYLHSQYNTMISTGSMVLDEGQKFRWGVNGITAGRWMIYSFVGWQIDKV